MSCCPNARKYNRKFYFQKDKEDLKNEIDNLKDYNNENFENVPVEKKPIEIIESYDSSHNYFYLKSSTLKLQKAFRRYKAFKNLLRLKTNSIQLDMSIHSDYTENLKIKNTQQYDPLNIKGLFLAKKEPHYYKGGLTRSNKIKQGFGIIIWENDNSTFESIFYNNKANGYGKFKCGPNMFCGEYRDSRPYGYGIFSIKENKEVNETEGIWCNNILNGIGFSRLNNKICYEGEYKNSVKEGYGKYKWPDGTIYEGEWKNDLMNGFGIIQYSDGSKYEGEVKDGFMHGCGEYTWKDGTKYIGSYENNLREGFGIMVWNFKDFQSYIGLWHKGKMNGVGMKVSGDQRKFGEWKAGVKEKWLKNRKSIKKWINEKRAESCNTKSRSSNDSSSDNDDNVDYSNLYVKKFYQILKKDLREIKKFLKKK